MECSYYVILLKSADINPEHPYTIIFKGYASCDNNKLFTFKYGGESLITDAIMSDKVRRDFDLQLKNVFGVGIMFDINKVRKQLETNFRFEMSE